MAVQFATLKAEAVRKYLKRVKDKVRVPANILRTVSNIFAFKDIIDHFKRQTGEKSQWKRRASSTQDAYKAIKEGRRKPPSGTSRRSFNPSNRILQLTGALRKSFIRGKARKFRKDSVIIKSNIDYSGKHDLGLGRMPKRDFMWLSRKARVLMLKSMLELAAGK